MRFSLRSVRTAGEIPCVKDMEKANWNSFELGQERSRPKFDEKNESAKIFVAGLRYLMILAILCKLYLITQFFLYFIVDDRWAAVGPSKPCVLNPTSK